MLLSSLVSRVNTAKYVLERWAAYTAERAALAEAALRAQPTAARVIFAEDAEPHFGNELVSHSLGVAEEHRFAVQRGWGLVSQHADAVAAWQVAARAAKNDSPFETVQALVAIAAERSLLAVETARKERRNA